MKIGLDIGYGNTKVVYANGSGPLTVKQFRSVVGTKGDIGATMESGFKNEILSVDIDGETYFLGATAEQHSSRQLNERDKGWITTPAYKALVKYALLEATGGREIKGHNQIVTGLPVKYFNTDCGKIEKVIKDVASGIGLEAEVESVYQPFGTYMNMILDTNGQVFNLNSSDVTGRLGILDIGFYTADLITIEKRQVTKDLSLSIESGISTALVAIQKDILESDEFGQRQTSLYEIENAIRNRYLIKVFGKDVSIRDVAEKRLKELVAELSSKARNVWHNGADFEKIVISGGGAEMLSHLWKLYPHAFVMQEAGQANATGYCKYATRKSMRASA